MKRLIPLSIIFSVIISLPAKAFTVKEIGKGFSSPLFATSLQENEIYVVEQTGKVILFNEATQQRKIFCDLSKKVTSGGEMGLLGLAFHPKFSQNKKFYLYYSTYSPKRVNVVTEFTPGCAEEKRLLVIDQPYSNHNGGHLAFGPDGFLYIAKGDGGLAMDPQDNGQNRNSLLGKILRIDVDREDPAKKKGYAIPADNPFAKGGGAPEVFAFGLRNPWRFSFDRELKTLWAGDVGQNSYEEIDIIEKGKNYGWDHWEGNHCLLDKCPEEDTVLPVLEYPRSEGVSITGGYVYRGKKVAALKGAYVYGDYDSGKIWALHYNPKTKKVLRNDLVIDTALSISSFGEDSRGEIFVVNHKGSLLRLLP